jgi:hypothetical protein
MIPRPIFNPFLGPIKKQDQLFCLSLLAYQALLSNISVVYSFLQSSLVGQFRPTRLAANLNYLDINLTVNLNLHDKGQNIY